MNKIEGHILIIDDDRDVLTTAGMFLKQLTTNVTKESDPSNILTHLEQNTFDVILLDMNYTPGKIDGKEGLFWLKKIMDFDKNSVVVMMTAYGNIQIAVDALKNGATDFIVKPWDNEKLLATINSAIELKKSKDEVNRLQETQQQLNRDILKTSQIIGDSLAIRKIFNMVDKVAPTDADVLILGENGTGKELLAREIHERSNRSGSAFIKVDLGSISESLFESELFGHVKGAFTDAKQDRAGRFEMAKGGTLFLDEIGNVPLNLQSKLLSVLQQRKLNRVGSTKEVNLNIRLICATNQNLLKSIEEGLFREDLYYRINTVELELPPLRNRPDDLEVLLNHFVKVYKKKYKKTKLNLSRSSLKLMKQYAWPGNIRELQHSVERAVILSENNSLSFPDFQFKNQSSSPNNESDSLDLVENEKSLILKAIERTQGHMSKAAKELGVTRSSLYRRLEKYDL
jgi:DNA-binding NtrC family response regulator